KEWRGGTGLFAGVPGGRICHTPLPCEVRKGNDITSRARSLAVQRGQDAGRFDLRLQLQPPAASPWQTPPSRPRVVAPLCEGCDGGNAFFWKGPVFRRGEEEPALPLRNGRGGALAEEFGSVTRRFPRSIIALEALSPMLFIHTRWIVMVPGR